MARKDALLRLHKSLVDRRDELLRRLGGEIKDLVHQSWKSGDSADMAFDSGSEEVSSQLAELESRELAKIDRAIDRLKRGTYGECEICHEICQKRIPIARLNALPFSTTCIQCQREMESTGGWSRSGTTDWGRVSDAEARMNEPRDVDVSKLEMDYAK
jgi:DnaK suppressor protein